MRSRFFLLPAVALACLAFSGCGSRQTAMGPEESNVLGIVRHEQASYAPVGPNTFRISADEAFARRNFSGDKTTFLWGLVTVTDY